MMPPGTMILVPCCVRKMEVPAPAKDLYLSYQFTLARAFAERSGQPWVILSALHHVLDPEVWVHPYDCKFPSKDPEMRKWGRYTAELLLKRVTGPTYFLSLCPPTYTRYMAAALRAAGHTLRYPLGGLGSGLQQLYLKTGPYEEMR